MKNHSEDSSLQVTTSQEASEHKLLRQAHGTGTANIPVIHDMFTTVHSPAFQNTQIFLTEATLSCSQIMYTDIFVAELMAEITETIISVEQ